MDLAFWQASQTLTGKEGRRLSYDVEILPLRGKLLVITTNKETEEPSSVSVLDRSDPKGDSAGQIDHVDWHKRIRRDPVMLYRQPFRAPGDDVRRWPQTTSGIVEQSMIEALDRAYRQAMKSKVLVDGLLTVEDA
jgi:hypothetical protein